MKPHEALKLSIGVVQKWDEASFAPLRHQVDDKCKAGVD